MRGPKELRARPVCAMCDKPVESFTEETYDKGALRGRVTFVARCHGAIERITIDRWQTRGLNFGVAFGASNALPAPPARRALPPGDPKS